jgi:spore germination cell wall hydrolase CwlJ-like protein
MKQMILFLALCLFPNTLLACPEEDPLQALTIAIYREAGGEKDIDGKIGVGEVIRNRIRSHHFEDSVCGVLLEKNQFPWTKKKGAFHVSEEIQKEEMFIASRGAAEQILLHNEVLMGSEALFFLNPDKLAKLPGWAKPSRIIGRIGNHVFYRAKKEG